MINKTPTLFTTAMALALFASNTFAVTTTSTNAAAKPADKVTELFGDPVIVKGKGIEIKRSELDSVLLNAKSAAAARGQNIPPQYISLVEQQLLARIIQVKLLLNSATDTDKIAGKERAEKRLDALFKRAGSDEMLNLQLKTMGLTKEEFSAKIADEATAEPINVRIASASPRPRRIDPDMTRGRDPRRSEAALASRESDRRESARSTKGATRARADPMNTACRRIRCRRCSVGTRRIAAVRPEPEAEKRTDRWQDP